MEENVDNATQVEAQPPAPETSAETENTDSQEHMIPKSRFDEKNQALKDALAKLADFEKAQKAAEDQLAVEQGKYKELWEKAQIEAQSAQDQLTQLRVDAMKREIATQAGYPSLWNRISGDTEESLKADMTALVQSLPKAQVPDIAGGTGTNERGAGKNTGMTKAEKAALAGRLGVLPEYIP